MATEASPRPDPDSLLSVRDIMALTRSGERTVYRWIRSGDLPCIRLGRAVRVKRSEVIDFVEQGRARSRAS